jgi:hypothetical protein
LGISALRKEGRMKVRSRELRRKVLYGTYRGQTNRIIEVMKNYLNLHFVSSHVLLNSKEI